MSKPSAIAAVTATLQKLLHGVADDVTVTALPPDKARDGNAPRLQLNLYLYQITTNASHRNDFSQFTSGSGDVMHIAPLSLNLHYLLTAYGPTETHDDWESQRLLGEAMSLLNSQPLLDRKAIRSISTGTLEGAMLDMQAERIRFVPHTLSLDDAYKIWSGFQTPFRLSVAYEASVVLIEPAAQAYRAPRVLRRGPRDQGPVVTTGVAPQLDSIRYPVRLMTPRGGFAPAAVEVRSRGEPDEITLVGRFGDCTSATVQFRPANGDGVIERPAFMRRDGIVVRLTPRRDDAYKNPPTDSEKLDWLPEFPADDEPLWHPGFYMVCVVVNDVEANGGQRTVTRLRTNSLVIAVAPSISGLKLTAAGNGLQLACTVEPKVQPNQRVMAIVKHRHMSMVSRSETGKLEFDLPRDDELPAGETARVRVRVDEVENLSLVRPAAGNVALPEFDPELDVEVP